MRSALLLVIPFLSCVSGGCGYPDFSFRAALPGADSSANDSAGDVIFPTDDVNSDGAKVDSGLATDGAAPETGPLDGGADTGLPETGPATGCKAAHVFCDDFDSSTDPWDKWGDHNLLAGGTAAIETDYVHSKPSSFMSYLPASGTTAAEVSADINRAFTPSTATTPARFDFWIRTDTSYDGGTRQIAKLMRGPNGRGVGLSLRNGHVVVDVLGDGTSSSYPYTDKPFNGGQWYHLRLEALLAVGTSGWFKFYQDDMTTPVLSATAISTCDSLGGDIRATLGFYSNTSTGDPSVRARFDDAAFDWL